MVIAAGVATTWIALLRGINVGTAKRVAMADLRAAIESLGYRDVRTLLNSGNVVFASSRALPRDAAARMQDALIRKTGVSSRFTLLPAADLGTIVRSNPLRELADDASRLFVAFPAFPEHLRQVQPLEKRRWAPERFVIGSRVAWMWCPAGMARSRLSAEVMRTLGDAVTVRNWATTTRLHALASE